jgi:hypothetical protein
VTRPEAETASKVFALSSDVASVRPAERLRAVIGGLSRYESTTSLANLLERLPRATLGLSPG